MAKVSIIVPTYNVEKYARTCFESLINQTLKDIEIILINDGSTDSSGKICDEYAEKDSRVKVIHQTNRGSGLSRNSGLNIATGEYIGFVDADDCTSPKMFQVLYENACKYNADISYCENKKFWNDSEISDDNVEVRSDIKIWDSPKEIKQHMLDRIGLEPKEKKDNLFGAPVWLGIFSRKFLQSINAKFVSEREIMSEDMMFNIDVIPHCKKIIQCDLPLYYYRFNPSSQTRVYKADRFEKNLIVYHEMYRRLLPLYKKEELFNCISRYLLTVARIAVIQEAEFVELNGKKKALENIKRICNCQELSTVLADYEYMKLPLKYAVICWMQRRKWSHGLLFLAMKHCKSSKKYAKNT